MNSLAPLPLRLEVEIVFDFVCPWCFLGIKRLFSVLQHRLDLDVTLQWQPFLLNPDMPRGGISRADYLIRKFGAEERAKRLHTTIRELGAAEGIAFNFSAIRQAPDSVAAHRLIREAAKHGVADSLAMDIFAAYFIEGLDIGKTSILANLAGRVGMDEKAVTAFLDREDDAELVYTENLRAHRLGINGVPCFIIGGEYAISGAQEGEVLERLMDLAASTIKDN